MRSRYSVEYRSMPLSLLVVDGRRQLHRFADDRILVGLQVLAAERREQAEERIRNVCPPPGQLLYDRQAAVGNVSGRVAALVADHQPAVAHLAGHTQHHLRELPVTIA